MMKRVLLPLALFGAAEGFLRGAEPLIADLANAAAGAIAARTLPDTDPTQAKALEKAKSGITVRDSAGKKILYGSAADIDVTSVQEAAKAKAIENGKKMMADSHAKMVKSLERAKAKAATQTLETAKVSTSRKLLEVSAADAKLQGAVAGALQGLRGGKAPVAAATPAAEGAEAVKAKAIENGKKKMADSHAKMVKSFEKAKAKAVEQEAAKEAAKAKAIENGKKKMADSHAKMVKSFEKAKAKAVEQEAAKEAAKAKAIENGKKKMADSHAKMVKSFEKAKAKAVEQEAVEKAK